MSMEMAAWSSMYHAMIAQQDKRPFSWETVKRILAFATPQRAQLVGFLVLSVVGAVLAVATPLLAGQVVERHRRRPTVRGRAAAGDPHRRHRHRRGRPGPVAALAVGADR